MKEGKVWGTNRTVFDHELAEIFHISVKKGGYCSEHYHSIKNNGFYVISGQLEITVWREDSGLVDVTVLGPGERMEVEAKQYHKFKALTDVEAVEYYYAQLYTQDIVRRTSGGIE